LLDPDSVGSAIVPIMPSILAHLTNIIVVTTVNGVYVLAVVGSVNSTALLVIQALLGIFKLSWSSSVIPSCCHEQESQERTRYCTCFS
jgi:hypothetical protein